jgi:hypothetical protein
VWEPTIERYADLRLTPLNLANLIRVLVLRKLCVLVNMVHGLGLRYPPCSTPRRLEWRNKRGGRTNGRRDRLVSIDTIYAHPLLNALSLLDRDCSHYSQARSQLVTPNSYV